MSDVVAPTDSTDLLAARERGWWRVLIATLLFLFVPVTPVLRILLPVDQTIVLLAPALACYTLVGWRAGGRLPLALVWTGLAAMVLWQLTRDGGPVALLVGGWSVLLAGSVGAFSLVQRDGAVRFPTLFPRAVAAIGLSLALSAGVMFAVSGGSASVIDAVRTAAEGRADEVLRSWRQNTNTTEWVRFTAQHPDWATMAPQVEGQLKRTPAYALMFFPSLLALESLAALALAWAVYHRVGRARIGRPLAALRDFRFNDELVWGLVAALVLVVVPWFGNLSRVGANLLVFFGSIYVVRGLGVGLWFVARARFIMMLLFGFALLFFWRELGALGPALVVVVVFALILALGLGLGDTWFDWRARARRLADRK